MLPDGLMNRLREYARQVAQHEMGHYVASRLLGFRTGDVTIMITDLVAGHKGGADIRLAEPLSSMTDVAAYLERRVIILYAGAPAETLKAGPPVKTVDREQAVTIIQNPQKGAEQGHAKARELIHILRSIRHSDTDPQQDEVVQAQLNAIDQDIWSKAIALVEQHAEIIVRLAGTLALSVRPEGSRII
jgi:hypothetical protein